MSSVATIGLGGLACSAFGTEEQAAMEKALGDVLSADDISSGSCSDDSRRRRRLDGESLFGDRGGPRRLDVSAAVDMHITVYAHNTMASSSFELAGDLNSQLTSASSDGSLSAAISARGANSSALASVSVTGVSVSTQAPTAAPSPSPSPAPTTTFAPTGVPTVSTVPPTSLPTPKPSTPFPTPGPTFIPIPAPTRVPIPVPTPMPTDAGCTDGRKSGDETDVDCGGSCPACDVAEACENADDCRSDVCTEGICITSYPTLVPSPVPSSSPTWTPCPWLEVPADPQLESAKFSSTGGQLYLQFSSPGTDRAGLGGTSFSCDQLVDFPGVSYATCAWTSDSLLTVSLDYRATCVPGDNVTALGGEMKAFCSYTDCSCWPTINASATTLLVPDVPLVPSAVFVGASRVGQCSDISLDVSTSSGSGGRDWLLVDWAVNSSLPVRSDINGSQNLTTVRNYLVRQSEKADPELEVPNRVLAKGEWYKFTVTLQNFLGTSSTSAQFEVEVALGSLPELMVTAGREYSMISPAQLAVFAQASVANCPGEKAGITALTYDWKCLFSCSSDWAYSSSVDPRYFKLPPFSLNASQMYGLGVTVTDANGYNNSAVVTIDVGLSDLVAAIDGGDRNLGSTDTLTLDASPSNDPDAPGDLTGLGFEWACSVLIGPGMCNTTGLLPRSILYLPMEQFGVGTFLFTVRVAKEYRGVWRNASVSAVIEATNSVPPPVSIKAISVAKANPSKKLVLTSVTGPSDYAFNVEWTLETGYLVTGALAATASTALTDSVDADATDTNYLVIPSGSLTAGSSYVFKLTAEYADPSTAGDAVGYSYVVVPVNAPPSSGSVEIDPLAGVVLQTAFDYKAPGWVDDIEDLPLLYSFFYLIYGENTEYQIISNTPSDSYNRVLLPRGGGNSSTIVGIVYVADQLGASTRTTAEVVCEPASISVKDLANMTQKLLDEALEAGAVEGLFQAMVASSSILNTVNCTRPCGSYNRETCPVDSMCGSCLPGFVGFASPSNSYCWALGTENCTNGLRDGDETDVDCGGGSCGPCGFDGTIDATCVEDEDCYYDMCQNNTCGIPQKKCAGAGTGRFGNLTCTGHGWCSYWDATGAQVLECNVDDWSCDPICSCASGWYGDACAQDEIAWAEIIALRNTMLGSLGGATGMQDVSTEALNQQASSLSSLATDPSQLSGGGELLALSLVGGIAGGSASVGIATGTDATVGGTLSSLLSSSLLSSNSSNTSSSSPTGAPTVVFRRRRLWSQPTPMPTAELADNEALAAVNDAIGSLSAAQLGAAVAGESAATIATDNVMMASSRMFSSDAAGASSSPPANAGGSSPAISLGSSVGIAYENGTEVASDAAVDTQIQQWGYNVYAGSDSSATETASALMSLGVSSEESDESGRRRRRRLKLVSRRRLEGDDEDDAPLTLVLQNVKPIIYSDGASELFVNLTCPAGVGTSDEPVEVSAMCPDTNATVSMNCTGRYPVYDPVTGILVTIEDSWSTRMACTAKKEPTCLLWNSAIQNYDTTLCKPKNWTSMNTTCVCSAEASEVVSGGGASFTSGNAALLGSFASMFSASAFLSALTNPNPLLVATFFTILFLVIVNIVLGIRNDMKDNSAQWTTVEAAKARRLHGTRGSELGEIRDSVGVTESAEVQAEIAAQQTLANFTATSLPDFVLDKSFCITYSRALHENHDWIASSAWGPYEPMVPKYIRAQVLGISLLWIMVGQALCFQLSYPDLGCDLYMTEYDCTLMVAPFDPPFDRPPACAWDPTLEVPCSMTQPEGMYTVMSLVLMVAVLILIEPIIIFVEWLYHNIFNAPRAKRRSRKEEEAASQQQQWAWEYVSKREASANAENFFESALTVPTNAGAPPAADSRPALEDMDSPMVAEAEDDIPSPKDKVAFARYIDMITAKDCIGVMQRYKELDQALEHFQAQAQAPGATATDANRVVIVAKIMKQFSKKWGFTRPWWQCWLMSRNETPEERIERLVRATVRRNVKLALQWDCELSELVGDPQERYLIELARFEMLGVTEQIIYMKNGGMSLEDAAVEPVRTWQKCLALCTIVFLTLFPIMYLLLFGVQQGSKMIKGWWISTMTCFGLEAILTLPMAIMVEHVFLPALIRRKIKLLIDPTALSRFPFKAPLHELPTTFLAHKHKQSLVTARSLLKRRGAADLAKMGAELEQPALAGAVVSYRRAKAKIGTRMLLTCLALMLLLPETAQGMVLDEILNILSLVVFLAVKAVLEVSHYWKLASSISVGLLLLYALYYCFKQHKDTTHNHAEDSDDEADFATQKKEDELEMQNPNKNATPTLNEWWVQTSEETEC